jgi:hypothetical protein
LPSMLGCRAWRDAPHFSALTQRGRLVRPGACGKHVLVRDTSRWRSSLLLLHSDACWTARLITRAALHLIPQPSLFRNLTPSTHRAPSDCGGCSSSEARPNYRAKKIPTVSSKVCKILWLGWDGWWVKKKDDGSLSSNRIFLGGQCGSAHWHQACAWDGT